MQSWIDTTYLNSAAAAPMDRMEVTIQSFGTPQLPNFIQATRSSGSLHISFQLSPVHSFSRPHRPLAPSTSHSSSALSILSPGHMVLWLPPHLIQAQPCLFLYVIQPLSYWPSLWSLPLSFTMHLMITCPLLIDTQQHVVLPTELCNSPMHLNIGHGEMHCSSLLWQLFSNARMFL